MSKFCTDFKDHPQIVRQIQKTKQKGPLAASVSEFFPACCAIKTKCSYKLHSVFYCHPFPTISNFYIIQSTIIVLTYLLYKQVLSMKLVKFIPY